MTIDEIDLIISILNDVVEKCGYDAEEVGFGHDGEGGIGTADDSDLEGSLEWLLSELYCLTRRRWKLKDKFGDYE